MPSRVAALARLVEGPSAAAVAPTLDVDDPGRIGAMPAAVRNGVARFTMRFVGVAALMAMGARMLLAGTRFIGRALLGDDRGRYLGNDRPFARLACHFTRRRWRHRFSLGLWRRHGNVGILL